MRAFLAVDVSPGARAAIAALHGYQPPSLRWVRPENLHLTLRFLGDVEPVVVTALRATLSPAVRDCWPFTYRLRSGGCFPSAKRPRVVWIGVDPVPEEMLHLHRVVETVVGEHGLSSERRVFHPHLTIARVKTPDRGVAAFVAELEGRDFGETEVGELALFESRLSPRGATYRAVERFELGRTGRTGRTVEKQLV